MSIYITLAEAKTHLRVDFTDDDIYIQALADLVEQVVINEITGTIEGIGTVTTNGTVNLTGVQTVFTFFQVGDFIKLPDETIRKIDTITSDTQLAVTVAFTNSATGITFEIQTGYPIIDGALPLPLHHSMLLMVGHFYQIREPAIIGVNINKIPFGFEFLIAPYKNYTIV